MAEKVERRLAAILSADVVGFSRMMAADETGTLARLQALRRTFIDPTIAAHRGRIVKLMGDGALVEFASVVDAVDCGLAIQRGMDERNAGSAEAERFALRVGINLGDIIVEGDDIYGDGVNIAARLEQLSEPGGIIVSANAWEQAQNKVDAGFEDLGPQSVKNIPQPVRAYRVLLDPAAAGTLVERAAAKPDRPRRTRWMIMGAATAIVAVGIAVGVLFTLEPWVERVEAASEQNMAFPLPEEPSLVVLPFENVGGDPAHVWLADGISGDLATHLGRLPDLFVIDGMTTRSYRERQITPKNAAEELGVRYVLGGSIQGMDEKLRITAQLVDALSGRQIWSERYDRVKKDLFALQDEITRGVSAALGATFKSVDHGLGRGTNIAAWELSLKAEQLMEHVTAQGLTQARALFEQAIETGGAQPAILTGIAMTHLLDARDHLTDDPGASFMMAVEANQRALELDETWPFSHSMLGWFAIAQGQYDEAIAHFRKAVALDPTSALVLGALAFAYTHAGRHEEALSTFNDAVRRSPFYESWLLLVPVNSYRALGRHEEALAVSRKFAELEPDNWMPWAGVASSLWLLGHKDGALEALGRLMEIQPTFSLDAVRGWNFDDTEASVAMWREMGIPEHPPLPLPDKPSIAVLPFANLSDDPEQEWFADGMTDDLITDLSKISGLFVIARNSAFTYKGKAVNVKAVGRELGVRYVLEGSVRRLGDSVRINAQLIDAQTGGHIWAERYDGAAADIFDLQEEVMGKIVSSMRVSLSDDEQTALGRAPTEDLSAYEHYSRGEQALRNAVYDSGRLALALEHFEQAIESDPGLAEAHVGDANAALKVWLGLYNEVLPGRDARARAETSAHRALTLNRDTAGAYEVLAHLKAFEGDIAGALDDARRAVTLAPNEAEIQLGLAEILTNAGHHDEAVVAVERALRLDPRPPPSSRHATAWVFLHARDYTRALTLLEQNRAERPDEGTTRLALAAAYAGLGRLDEAKSEMGTFLGVAPNSSRQLWKQLWLPFRLDEDIEHFLALLETAGMPEWPFGIEGRPENRLSEKELQAYWADATIAGTIDLAPGTSRTYTQENVDGRWEWLSKGFFSATGNGAARDGMSCARSANAWMGRWLCGHIYRNPDGTRAQRNEFIGVYPDYIYRFSILPEPG